VYVTGSLLCACAVYTNVSVQKWFFRSWNFRQESDLNVMPVNMFAWRRFDDCWSPETTDHRLVCADQEAPAGLAGAVFAVGTPLAAAKTDIKKCMSHFSAT